MVPVWLGPPHGPHPLAQSSWMCKAQSPRGTFDGTVPIWGVPKIRGPIFGSPYNKSPTILGYILGPLILESPISL